MSDVDQKKPVESVDVPAVTESKKTSPLLLVIVVFVFSLGLGFLSYGWVYGFGALTEGSSPALSRMSARLDTLELRVKKIDDEVRVKLAQESTPSLVEPMAKTEGQPETPLTPVERKQKVEELAQLKGDLQSLSSSLGLLQDQLDKSSLVVSKNRQIVENGFASVIAFMKLQRRAFSGHPFETERLTMRQVASEDQALIDILSQMEPIALTGADDPLTLSRKWRAFAPDIERAIRKGNAQTWYERVVVALEGMVSIRSLSDKTGPGMSFSAIQMDFDAGDVTAALAKIEALPAPALEVVKDFQAKVRARAEVEKQIDEIAAHLMTKGHLAPDAAETPEQVPVPTEGQGKPK